MNLQLKEMLVELYDYYFAKAKNAERGSINAEETYNTGRFDGACEAVEAIMFNLYGGKFCMEQWLRNIGEDEEVGEDMLSACYPQEDGNE